MVRVEDAVNEYDPSVQCHSAHYAETRELSQMPTQSDRLVRGANALQEELADWAAQILLGQPRPWPVGEGTKGLQVAHAFFNAEGIGALCYQGLTTAHLLDLLSKDVWDLLRKESHAAAVSELIRSRRDTQVLQWLGEIGLQPLVLKGAAYAHTVYPEAYLRPRCDTDLLFADKASAEEACRRLEQEGYALMPSVVEGRFVSRQKTCVNPTFGGHALDIHWAVSNTHTFVRALPYDELKRYAVPLPSLQANARTLGPVHSLLFACVHLFGHQRIEHQSRLIWRYDIYLLGRQMSDGDWQRFATTAVNKGVAGICRHALDRVHARFPLEIPASIRAILVAAEPHEAFRPDRLRTPLLYALHDLSALDDWVARLQCVREALFPSRAYILGKYGKTNGAWLPLLYLRRTASGMAKRLRSGRG